MFRVDDTPTSTFDSQSYSGNYKIAQNDLLIIDIYTGKGEKLIDPDKQLSQNPQAQQQKEIEYLVHNDGTVDLPMIGKVDLLGLSLREASDVLEEKFTQYYKDPFVLLRFVNKRVFVLGATGIDEAGKVIPLVDNEVTVSEVLALAGGLTRNSNAGNIRLIRGEQVKVLDLSNFSTFKENNVVVLPGDILYVEPVRRPFSEFFKENYGIFGVTTGIISLVSVIISLNK